MPCTGPCASPREWNLHDCNGNPLSHQAQVPTCEQMHAAIDNATGTRDGVRLRDCDGNVLAPDTQVVTCGEQSSFVVDTIVNGDTTHAPSGNAVHDALLAYAPLNSPVFQGNPRAPTPDLGDADNSIATTEFVAEAIAELHVSSTLNNTSVGVDAFEDNTTGTGNVAVGAAAMRFNTTGDSNVAVGREALQDNIDGSGNTALGDTSLPNNTSGWDNVSVGRNAMLSSTTGNNNTVLGANALTGATTAGSNTAVGYSALNFTTAGSNVAVGAEAGRFIADGVTAATDIENSVLVGAQAYPQAAADVNAIVVGYQAIGQGSNTAVWGNTSITDHYMSGRLNVAGGVVNRIQTIVSSATVTPTFANDMVKVTAQATALFLANPSGTHIEGHGIVFRFKDDGTARAITYDTEYRAIGVTLPTTTVIGKTLYLAGIWNETDTKYDIVAVAQEA